MLKTWTGSLAVAVAVVGSASIALAADMRMPTKAPPLAPPPPAINWTGFYAGVNLGYGIGDDPVTETTISGAQFPILGFGTPIYGAPKSYSIDPKGVNGGGQIGYNLQFAPSWVAGLEADIQGSAMKNTQNCIIPCGAEIATVPALSGFPVAFSSLSEEHKIDWFGTVRGRFGYAAGPVLVYATGGLAYGEVNRNGSAVGQTFIGTSTTVLNSFAGSYNANSTKTGWTVGGGVEGQLNPNWSVKAEYLYVDLGSTTDSFSTFYTTAGIFPTAGQAGVRTITSSFRENIFRMGLNYKFGG